MKHQTAAILVIGNEILSGRTHELNAHLAAQRFFDWGCRLREIIVVPDVESRIVAALNQLRHASDAVITSGGIGPTHDDITMQAVATAFNVPLHEHAGIIKAMAERFGMEKLNPARRKMAVVPEGASLIRCRRTPSPGIRLENVYVLAGVPDIFAEQLEVIAEDFGGKPMLRREVEVSLPESLFAKPLADLQTSYPDIEIGSYPGSCRPPYSGKICLNGSDVQRLDAAFAEICGMIDSLREASS
ncbi:MAG: molybdopterin-binding protein [Mariprofundaceae bacterium]